jgi:U3 small nucleolar RNA-associated protein 14
VGRRRDAALAGRKDAALPAVVISERWDRKAAKYGTPAVPHPFDCRATYDRSLRQPLGRDFNTDAAFRCALRAWFSVIMARGRARPLPGRCRVWCDERHV